jgi:hypothetical protein
MRGVREYPKIIAERERSSMAASWREYLRLALNDDGTATLAVCRYEVLASVDEFANEGGEVNLPDKIAGKTVVGVEDDWIVGGELTCYGSGWTYGQSEFSGAIGWVRINGWVPTNAIVTEILQAAFTSALLRKPEEVPLALSPH